MHSQLPADQPVELSQHAAEHSQHATDQPGEYELFDWIISFLPQCQGVCVEGIRTDTPDSVLWHSSIITKRIKPQLVSTCTGSIYRLQGKIEKYAALDAGIPLDMVMAFRRGFPEDWSQLASKGLSSGNLRRQSAEKQVLVTSKSDTELMRQSFSSVTTDGLDDASQESCSQTPIAEVSSPAAGDSTDAAGGNDAKACGAESTKAASNGEVLDKANPAATTISLSESVVVNAKRSTSPIFNENPTKRQKDVEATPSASETSTSELVTVNTKRPRSPALTETPPKRQKDVELAPSSPMHVDDKQAPFTIPSTDKVSVRLPSVDLPELTSPQPHNAAQAISVLKNSIKLKLK